MSKLKYMIDQISPRVSGLPWVGRYGGLVQTATQGKTNSIETYPVACGVTSVNCKSMDPLHDLVPDDSVSSIFYWEEVSPMRSVSKGPLSKGSPIHYYKAKGSARLVAWMNLKMLGISGCSTPIEIIMKMESLLTTRATINFSGTQLGRFTTSVSRDGQRNAEQLFGKYSYPKSSHYYLTPYDYFSIIVDFELTYNPACADDFVLQPPITC
ncbi:hypothetical protein [Gilvibacter sp.]|uniref:hypothetical protein n=1 Tax=Gilvibacter sp. TaxID=2729997 RepID=UPI0025BFE530|nr:hypothetical protein [Gilvibacter sp.]